MDCIQVITIVAFMLLGVYAFFMITSDRIDRLEDRFNKIDEKWERLFERLYKQEKSGI